MISLADDLAEELHALHRERGHDIRETLASYRAVPRDRYFYELCYCLMTPQSKALHCDAAVRELERRGFRERPFDPRPVLHPSADRYVRFHHVKSERLLALRDSYNDVEKLLDIPDDKQARDALAARVKGLGMKEASHFLRNIGRTRVTIVDRHILRNLLRLGVLDAWPTSLPPSQYRRIETLFEEVAAALSIPADELDLVLWSRETGFVLR